MIISITMHTFDLKERDDIGLDVCFQDNLLRKNEGVRRKFIKIVCINNFFIRQNKEYIL
jgi:hypothetical protein